MELEVKSHDRVTSQSEFELQQERGLPCLAQTKQADGLKTDQLLPKDRSSVRAKNDIGSPTGERSSKRSAPGR